MMTTNCKYVGAFHDKEKEEVFNVASVLRSSFFGSVSESEVDFVYLKLLELKSYFVSSNYHLGTLGEKLREVRVHKINCIS
jgi:hypothetical protein